MEINCKTFSAHIFNGEHILNCEQVRADLLIESIVFEEGEDFILNAIGDEAIQKYLARQQAA